MQNISRDEKIRLFFVSSYGGIKLKKLEKNVDLTTKFENYSCVGIGIYSVKT